VVLSNKVQIDYVISDHLSTTLLLITRENYITSHNERFFSS